MERGYAYRELIPYIIDCTRELYRHSAPASPQQSLFATNEALYYIFPIVLTIGIIFSIINTVITAKMAVDSHECYMVAFNLSCTLMLVAACVFQLPNYVRQSANEYTVILPYLPAVETWCWYCCTWLLITMVTERSMHAMCGKWHSSFGKIHGTLAAILIMAVCFVSTLPSYWEYRLALVDDALGEWNCTRGVLVPRDNILQQDGSYIAEYNWYHWFEMVAGVSLPYLLLPMTLIPLVCVKVHIYTSMPSANGKSKYSIGPTLKEQLRQERSFNRLIFTIAILYLLMSGPRNVFRLMHSPPISVAVTDDPLLLSTLSVLFDVLFYSFFSSLFFLYLTFGSKFRTTLYHLCCCKKTDVMDYY